ncbi:UxaA family hydrolase [Metabacillus rhizolycopersici]|uniref:UxaA family hydrolase n=1 Tax=Metabacillus rhizolycopersici TaxID=2875709 RepID=A0ABS7UVX8_9BACI|nr:UxaA family hydrolase [Metabacillus rhizolycopersici]MBZ5752162.1 UxaA family hydrolase [Metabacillus rhizolycopersici]
MSKLEYEQDITSIVMSDNDNVATLLKDLEAGQTLLYVINGQKEVLTAKQSIPFGHKISIKPIQRLATVIKYGEVIGAATTDIEPGEHVHVHNIEGIRGRGDKAEGDRKL